MSSFRTILITSLAAAIASGCIDVPRTTAHDEQLSRTMIDGYPIYTEKYGDETKPVLLVLHGGPGGDALYLKSVSALADTYQVILYDQRGTGLSPRIEMETGQSFKQFLDRQLDDLNALVQHYGRGGKVRLIGHSWGGMLATAYVARHPEKVSHALIAEPGLLTPETAKIFIEKIKAHQSIGQMVGIIPTFAASLFVRTIDGQERYDYVMTEMLGSGRGAPYQCEGESLPEGSFRRAGFAIFRNTIMPMMDDPSVFSIDLTEGIKKFRGKVLLLSSECSFIGYEYQERYHRHLLPAQTEHWQIEKEGHNMFTIRPEKSIQVAREFFAR